MLGISVILLAIISIAKAQVDVELGYLRLARKMARLEITGFENFDNLNAQGNCCSGPLVSTVCRPCSSVLRFVRYDTPNRTRVVDLISFRNSSSSTFFTPRLFLFNPDEHISFQITHSESSSGSLLDAWSNYSTLWVGRYVLNGVWGTFGNVLLIYNIEILPVPSYSSYFSVTFRVYRVEWLKKEFSDGACCQTVQSATCDNACPFVVQVSANDDVAFVSAPSTYRGNLTSYFVKGAIGSTSAFLQRDNLRLKLSVLGFPDNKLIDEITINPFRAIADRDYEFNSLTGSFSKIRMNIDIKYECRGYRGFNCRYFCSDDTKNVDCNFETGTRFCANGASNLPICNIFTNTCGTNHCINNGVCSPLPTGFNCICPSGFKGKYCEEPSCELECKNGVCVNNVCVCDATYEGNACDTTSCPASAQVMCQNGGVCKVKNGVIGCVCPLFTSGANCEIPVCSNNCLVGNCDFVKATVPVRAECVCANSFTGDSCEIRPLKLVFNDDTIKVVLISIFCTLLVLSAKLFLMLIFVKFETSVNFRKGESTDSTKKDRPNSLSGL